MNQKKNLYLFVFLIFVFVFLTFGFYFYKNRINFIIFNKVSKKEISKELKTSDHVSDILQANADLLNNLDNVQKKEISVKKISSEDYYQGDLNSPVKIIVYDDLSNEFSAEYYNSLQKLLDYFKGEVVIAYRHFPELRNQLSLYYALADECAGEQGEFFQMRKDILNNNFSKEDIFTEAEKINLDMEKFKKCMESNKYKEKILQEVADAKSLDILGTPTTFINNKFWPGAYPFEDFTDSTGRKREGLKTIVENILNPKQM